MYEPTLTLEVNREVGESLEASSSTVETTGSFEIRLRGHNVPAHVHCRLEGELTSVTSLERSNYYVEPDETRSVPIEVSEDGVDEPKSGTLTVSSGYGAETVEIAMTVVPGPPEVDVDKTLSEPKRPEPEPSPLESVPTPAGIDPATLGVAVLAALALGIGVVTAGSIGGPIAIASLLVVGCGVAVAVWLLA